MRALVLAALLPSFAFAQDLEVVREQGRELGRLTGAYVAMAGACHNNLRPEDSAVARRTMSAAKKLSPSSASTIDETYDDALAKAFPKTLDHTSACYELISEKTKEINTLIDKMSVTLDVAPSTPKQPTKP